jgi:RNA binding exosome subunit
VKAIDGDRITVENQYGNLLYVSRDIVEKMDSGSHFVKEVAMNMTGLAELLTTVSDKVFTVKFKKQASVESA